MGVVTVIPILNDPDSPSSLSKSCQNKGHSGVLKILESSCLSVKEMNNKHNKKDRLSKSITNTIPKRNISTEASKKFCLCAPTTHAGSFKCRLHRTTTASRKPSVSSSAYYSGGAKNFNKTDNKYRIILNPTKLVLPLQGVGVRNSNKGNVRLSRFGRAALAASGSTTVQVQPISAALAQMNLN